MTIKDLDEVLDRWPIDTPDSAFVSIELGTLRQIVAAYRGVAQERDKVTGDNKVFVRKNSMLEAEAFILRTGLESAIKLARGK